MMNIWDATTAMNLNSRAEYSYSVEFPFICIIDHNTGARSVSNDAERIIADLVAEGIRVDEYVIIYQDSEGVWDRMLTDRGWFVGFLSINERDKDQAKRVIKGEASHSPSI